MRTIVQNVPNGFCFVFVFTNVGCQQGMWPHLSNAVSYRATTEPVSIASKGATSCAATASEQVNSIADCKRTSEKLTTMH